MSTLTLKNVNGNITGITAFMVGLGNVNNTPDVAKPVSIATQNALNLKADISFVNQSIAYLIDGAPVTLDTLREISDYIKDSSFSLINHINRVDASVNRIDASMSLYAKLASPTFTGTVGGISKSMVGLSDVDNTTDASKPVSTATQTALNLKADKTYVDTSLNTNYYVKSYVDASFSTINTRFNNIDTSLNALSGGGSFSTVPLVAPTNPVAGSIFYDIASQYLYIYHDSNVRKGVFLAP